MVVVKVARERVVGGERLPRQLKEKNACLPEKVLEGDISEMPRILLGFISWTEMYVCISFSIVHVIPTGSLLPLKICKLTSFC